MPSAYLDLDRDLAEILKLVLNELKKNRVLENVADPEALIEDTVSNIKEALGDSISRESLNEPGMKLKLATALVATFTHGKGQDKFNFELLFQPINEMALKKELTQMLGKYFALQPEEAKAFVELTNTFELSPAVPSAPRPKPDGGISEEPTEEDKSIFAAVFTDDGTLLDVLEGVSVSAKDASKSIITLSEMLSSNFLPEYREQLEENHFLKNIQESISEAKLNTNTPRLAPGSHY